MKFYEDNQRTLYQGDCRHMVELDNESVQCVVTSPPYWGLRKYEGNQDLIWGGDNCEHEWGSVIPNPMTKSGKHGPASILTKTADAQHAVRKESNQGSFCSLCGAWKGQFGLEPTPELYVQHTVEILREIRRVLRKDGVCFWNCGDSYYGSGGDHKEGGKNDAGFQGNLMRGVQAKQEKHSILKPKDLCLIPFRVALATQRDGWWVRSVIIWNKPNPMPESVKDRPTNSYEFILMLTKSARYYWDADAVREPHETPLHNPGNKDGFDSRIKGHRGEWGEFKEPDRIWGNSLGRNLRDVWTFPTTPFPSQYVEGEKLDHFAVFPEKLPELCIKAATSEKGCCPKCGAPWARIIGRTATNYKSRQDRQDATGGAITGGVGMNFPDVELKTIGWKASCDCGLDPIPCTILDPFAGSGTTLLVATRLGRKSVGYELSAEYCKMAVSRNRQGAL